MSECPEQPRLLDDVLSEAATPDFRAALLGETLRLARQRRRRRQVRQTVGVLGVLILAAWFAWRHLPQKMVVTHVAHPPPKAPTAKPFQLVVTQPLPSAALVATKEFAPVPIISSRASVVQIATTGDGLRFITDTELLALAKPEQALLIRTGPDSEELVFAGVAASTKGPPAN